MMALFITLLMSTGAMALEIPRQTLASATILVDEGPTTYKNFSCAQYFVNQGYACQWKNTTTNSNHRLEGNAAKIVLESLVEQGASLKCTYSQWGDVCDVYFSRVNCNDSSCTLKPL